MAHPEWFINSCHAPLPLASPSSLRNLNFSLQGETGKRSQIYCCCTSAVSSKWSVFVCPIGGTLLPPCCPLSLFSNETDTVCVQFKEKASDKSISLLVDLHLFVKVWVLVGTLLSHLCVPEKHNTHFSNYCEIRVIRLFDWWLLEFKSSLISLL